MIWFAGDSRLHHADWLRGCYPRCHHEEGVLIGGWSVEPSPSSGSGRLEGFGGSKHRPHFGHQVLKNKKGKENIN